MMSVGIATWMAFERVWTKGHHLNWGPICAVGGRAKICKGGLCATQPLMKQLFFFLPSAFLGGHE